MAFQTPARHIPGAYVNTPAPVNRRLFTSGGGSNDGSQQNPVTSLPPVLRASQTVNQVLSYDEGFPDLDAYCRRTFSPLATPVPLRPLIQVPLETIYDHLTPRRLNADPSCLPTEGTSSEYDICRLESPWAPFAQANTYPIPNSIFGHINAANVSTLMGLFAELNHAWVAIDNALYLWDYTHPDPELIGFEDQQNAIQAVGLVPPKPGVFVQNITHILVVATTSEIILLGVSAKPLPSGSKQVSLYQTKMSLHNRGSSDIHVIRGAANGRIFYGGSSDMDVHELYYQQEEKWFSSRCGRINHSNPGWSNIVPNVGGLLWNQSNEHLIDIVIDNSRNLLYTLSSKSTIRTYHMEGPDKLTKVIEKEKYHCLRDITHMINYSQLLTEKVEFVSISPIAAKEASRLHLMVLTNTGCRLFLSATSSASYMAQPSSTAAPQSMQVQFIKFPPSLKPRQPSRPTTQLLQNGTDAAVDINSPALTTSRSGARFAPGYFLDFVKQNNDEDMLFVSAPETGRIKLESSPPTALKYYEHGCWIDIKSKAEDIGLVGKPFAANNQPQGFGNELAVQFDAEASQFAILTNTGVHIIKRRRMVDIFASAIRGAVGDEGLEKEARKFIVLYGRVETISCALAVACGNTGDSGRGGGRAIDQTTEDRAKAVFVEFGGQPTIKEVDNAPLSTESVKLSSRHDALCLYLSRLVRSLWKSRVVRMTADKAGALDIKSQVDTSKLAAVQERLERLKGFLNANRGLIQGLSGPSDLQRAANRQDEIAMQAEHQALYAIQKLMESISEGISFVLMLFDERVVDIFLRLEDGARQQLRDLTYEKLFSQTAGKDLAKVLVKAIVNRNIESGSNVETVADALRRRCGSFCSPDDVVIFRAQEQLKKASEQTPNTNIARNMLAESLRLFESVAGGLSFPNLVSAIEQYIALKYYAGAIQLCLSVASQKDKGNSALIWFNDGKPMNDPRQAAMQERERCYSLVHEVMTKLDDDAAKEPEQIDGKLTLMGTKRKEAYDVVNDSEDEMFHYNLYDWYIHKGWNDRILAIDSPHVITYLQRLALVDLQHADLLCKFYTHRGRFFEAAAVQAELAKSDFAIGVKDRITLLSRAKANASVITPGTSRQEQQMLTHTITDLLEVAHIQDDLLERLRQDVRLAPERREDIERMLDGQIQDLSDLFNEYADQANYYDLCLLIYHAADYRNPTTIAQTWDNLIMQLHMDAEEEFNLYQAGRLEMEPAQPFEIISAKVTEIAHRSSLDSFVFPVSDLLRIVCKYTVENQQDGTVGADPCWPVIVFLQLGVSHDMVARVLEDLLENNEIPFQGRQTASKVRLVEWIVYTVQTWLREMGRRGGPGGGGPAAGLGGSLRGDSSLGTWVREVLLRAEQELPPAGPNHGGTVDVAELRRQLRETMKGVDGVVGVGLAGDMRFL
ncbi:putative non-repetitive/WGA-negative nucleoporin [Zalerion maritima]|uniref:Non-repetitive/WGA-negative nucleoporin n=1 Tax=Zalerion maritima TaxID=339359 RepID=A0AAD5WR61_9PEZI|nr:putative non-repetitive/WGA-negative nucleoporin [Zalerion maritima]